LFGQVESQQEKSIDIFLAKKEMVLMKKKIGLVLDKQMYLSTNLKKNLEKVTQRSLI